MKASDIKKQTFKKKMSGYDREAVDEFLLEASRSLDNLETDNQRLQQELYERNAELDEFHGKIETLNRSIVVAQEAADHLRQSALDEADLIVRKAEEEGQRILQEAADRASKVNEETTHLQEASRMYLHQSIGMAKQARDMFQDSRWTEAFDKNPHEHVETPELDSVLKDLDLPIRNQQGYAIYASEEDVVNKEKDKEAFFNDNDKPAVFPEEVQRILESEGKAELNKSQTNQTQPSNNDEITSDNHSAAPSNNTEDSEESSPTNKDDVTFVESDNQTTESE